MLVSSLFRGVFALPFLLGSVTAQVTPSPEMVVAGAAAHADTGNAFKRHVHGAHMHPGFQRQRRRQTPESSVLRRRDNSSTSDTGNDTSASTSSNATSSDSSSASTSSSSNKLDGYWYGASSYYLYALADSDRYAVLDALKNNGFKVVRIFIGYVGANNKGSNSREVQDLEPQQVGTYDDTVLLLIDQLMYDCKVRGLKLLIALSDRYQLGFWGTDAYATQLDIVKAGSSGAQKVANAASYYTSSWAANALDNRIKHILTHKNSLIDSRSWADLDDVVYAFEAQNEPQGHMAMASATWVCDRSAFIKGLLPSGSAIQVSSGGGITIDASLGGWATSCDSIDIISVHDYGTSAQTAVDALKNARSQYPDKTVLMGEWGIAGAQKASTIASFVSAFKAAGLPWMYWEIVKPGMGAADFEVWTNEGAWGALTGGSYYNDPVAQSSTTTAAAATSAAPTSSAWASQGTQSKAAAQSSWSNKQTYTKTSWSSKAWASASPTQGGNGSSKSAQATTSANSGNSDN